MPDALPAQTADPSRDLAGLDADLFDLLVCPLARRPLKLVEGRLVSTDPETRRAYRIEDGIPIMLVEAGTPLDQATWERLMAAPGPIGQGVAAVQARHGRDAR